MKWLIQWAITSGVLILILLAVRFLLREKLSARWRYALWAVVLVRLLVPFQVTLPAPVSKPLPLLATNMTPEVDRWEERSIPVFPQSSRPVDEFNGITFDLLEPGEIMPTETSMGYYQRSQDGETVTRYLDLWSPEQIVLLIWRSGTAAMALVLLASNLLFARRLKKRRKPLELPDVPLRIYTAEGLPSPCLFGLFRPAVYVTPEAADNPDVLRHELTHYAHFDHIWSLLRCLALALHWYNPLVWLAAVLSKRDGELACDEGAVARLGEAERIPYGRTLVDMVAARSLHPADLLSCSTAMTGGRNSIQQRVARLVKKPQTVKTALFAAAAVVVLAVVFVFAGREETDSTEYNAFLTQVEAAQSIFVGNPSISSQSPPPAITDPAALAQAKELLSAAKPVIRLEDGSLELLKDNLDSSFEPEPITQEELERQFLIWGYRLNLYPTAERDPDAADRYYLVCWDNYCSLTRWCPEREENKIEVLASLPGDTVNRLMALARGEAYRPETNLTDLERFQTQVEQAASIRLILPAHSSQSPPVPITDEEVLALARERLSAFVPQSSDPAVTDWNEKLPFASQIVLSDGKTETAYALLAGEDNRTYLFSDDDYNACLASGEGETTDVAPIGRTRKDSLVEPSLLSYSRLQEQRTDDPGCFVPMTYTELKTYTPAFLLEQGITRLQGWDGSVEDVRLDISAYTARDRIQLRYRGDEAHKGYWVLLLDRESGAVLADQPLVVFLIEQQKGEQFIYETLTSAAIAAALQSEDVVSVTAGNYAPGQEIQMDIPALKEQLVQSLYHQFSAEYDEEKYGRYFLTLHLADSGKAAYMEHGLAEDTNRLTLSVGREADAVCLQKTTFSANDIPDYTFVHSPELYRTIRNLFD